MSTNVKVVVRIRPLNTTDGESCVSKVADDAVELIRGPTESLRYTFDAVYSETASQKELFAGAVQNTLNSLLQGVNTTIFCYGITGSGKTHTMQGTEADPGITTRAVSHILDSIQSTPNCQYTLKMSYFEIYNDKIYDLLCKTTGTALPMREDMNKQIIIQNLSETTISSLAEFQKVYSFGLRNRKVSSTGLNANSSRSHGLLRLRLICEKPNQRAISSKLHLIDLAGSEDNRRTNNAGARMTESAAINSSLFVLAQVVEGLKKGSARVPFRQSALTRLLQDSLGGHAHCLLIGNIAPGKVDAFNTIRTLEFASNSRHVRNTPATNEPEPVQDKRRPWLLSNAQKPHLGSAERRINPKLEPSLDIESLTNELWSRVEKRITKRDIEIKKRSAKVGPHDKEAFGSRIGKMESILSTKADPRELHKDKKFDPALLTPQSKLEAAKHEIMMAKQNKELDPERALFHYKEAYRLYPESKKVALKIEALEREINEEMVGKAIRNATRYPPKSQVLETPYVPCESAPNLWDNSPESECFLKLDYESHLFFDSSSEEDDSSSDETFALPKMPTPKQLKPETKPQGKENASPNLAPPTTHKVKKTTVNTAAVARLNLFLKELDAIDKEKKYDDLLSRLNTGTYPELLKIKTVGGKRADQILKFRADNGAFTNVCDLIQIDGFGEQGVKSLMQKNLI